jgi:hypothetical protein
VRRRLLAVLCSLWSTGCWAIVSGDELKYQSDQLSAISRHEGESVSFDQGYEKLRLEIETYAGWYSFWGPVLPVIPWVYFGRDRFRVSATAMFQEALPESLLLRVGEHAYEPTEVETLEDRPVRVFTFKGLAMPREPFTLELPGWHPLACEPFHRVNVVVLLPLGRDDHPHDTPLPARAP